MLTTFPMSSSRSRSSSSSRHSLGVLAFVGIFSDNNGTATVAVPCLPAARQKNTSRQNQQQQMKLHKCTIDRAKKYKAWLLNNEISFKKNYFINKIISTCYSLQINLIRKVHIAPCGTYRPKKAPPEVSLEKFFNYCLNHAPH